MWKDIKGYEGLYEINEKAEIRRIEGTRLDGRKVRTHCVHPSKTEKGTLYIALWKDGVRRTVMLHKLYAENFGISRNEACRRIYKGFTGEKQAIDNVKEILLRNIAILKKEQAAGKNSTDEILYMEQFLKELEKDKIGYIRDIKFD